MGWSQAEVRRMIAAIEAKSEPANAPTGGTCPKVGCVPTKMLVHYSAKRIEDDVVTAPTILINTGWEPAIADIPGLANSNHLVSSRFRVMPEHHG
jgi:pyruvate/2-oxoglutarate dehydrogenase complex dihydrolipoamide dehydrogenase (E3) component